MSRTAASICWPTSLSCARSSPISLMPMGVLMPVASMSMRVLIGIVQALVSPGNCTIPSSSVMMSSMVLARVFSTVLPWRMTV